MYKRCVNWHIVSSNLLRQDMVLIVTLLLYIACKLKIRFIANFSLKEKDSFYPEILFQEGEV